MDEKFGTEFFNDSTPNNQQKGIGMRVSRFSRRHRSPRNYTHHCNDAPEDVTFVSDKLLGITFVVVVTAGIAYAMWKELFH